MINTEIARVWLRSCFFFFFFDCLSLLLPHLLDENNSTFFFFFVIKYGHFLNLLNSVLISHVHCSFCTQKYTKDSSYYLEIFYNVIRT
jgi:hypothetical protein